MNMANKTFRKSQPKWAWTDYLWLASIAYFVLGFFNILFAWLGLLCIATPILQASLKNDKSFCYNGCPRSKLLDILGNTLKLSPHRRPPALLSHRWFRKIFMILFFGSMYVVFCTTLITLNQRPLSSSIIGLWQQYNPRAIQHLDKVPNNFLRMFALASYTSMSISLVLGVITMLLYKPRTWCAFCPMGTLTQSICQDNVNEALRSEKRKAAKAKKSL
jgi:polyferredoxin